MKPASRRDWIEAGARRIIREAYCISEQEKRMKMVPGSWHVLPFEAVLAHVRTLNGRELAFVLAVWRNRQDILILEAADLAEEVVKDPELSL